MKSAVALPFAPALGTDSLTAPHFLRLPRRDVGDALPHTARENDFDTLSAGAISRIKASEFSKTRPFEIPAFRPHTFVRGGHAQTISGLFFPGDVRLPQAGRHVVPMPDGDAIVLHDESPPTWRKGGPAAILVHGLTGDSSSSYMVRTARKLCDRGIRAFRMDMRSAGAAWGLSRRPYHAGCSHDVLVALKYIAELTEGGPTGVVGYSLGGNIILKLLGESPESLPENVVRAVAVNPSVDLHASSRALERPVNRIYAQHFVRAMCRHLATARDLIGRDRITALSRTVRFVREFDDLYTAPVSGFGCADEYYAASSAKHVAQRIQVPTLILAAADDPMIPVRVFEEFAASPSTVVHMAPSGGHLGFIGRSGLDPDRRWMDWRVVDWLAAEETAAA